MILGKFNPSDLEDSYSIIAKNLKMCHFDFGTYWSKLESMVEPIEMFRINAKFLEINIRKTFYFTHDPRPGSVFRTRDFARELEFIEKIIEGDYATFGDEYNVLWKLR